VARLQRGRLGDLGRRGGAAGGLPAAEAGAARLTAAGPRRRLDRFLAEAGAGLSRSAAARLVREGAVRLNSRPARASSLVGEGDVVEFDPPVPRPVAASPEAIPLEVVYEDADFVVVVKPAGMVTHPGPGHSTGTLVHALLGLGGRWSGAGGEVRPGIVHRLDRGTSGLIVAARTDAAHRTLAAQLADRTLSRTYLAVVRGEVATEAGILEGDIGRDPRRRQRMAVVSQGRFARTRYRVAGRRRGHSLLSLELETGRTHQIRVHLAAFGHPVAGDDQYGRRRSGDPARPLLHAQRLSLRHPRTGEPLTFESPPPADFTSYWESLA